MSEVKFIPPEQNPWLVRSLQSFFYLVAYFVFNFRLVISEADLAKVRAIANSRVVYLPNHSNLDDGMVVFQLSARVGQMFHYIVAIEAFRGAIGKLIRKVGAYSIRRGVADRPSVVQTLKILQEPAAKLVIFPEGGCSYQNDTVIPFRTGAVELAFKALERLYKQSGAVADLYIVPVSLKYCYPEITAAEISQALRDLEAALEIKTEGDNYVRIRAISERILTNLEAEYLSSQVDITQDGDRRIQNLRTRMLDYCEEKLDLTSRVQMRDRERVYKIQSVLRNLEDRDKNSAIDYEHIYLTTVRLLNFDAIYDGYIAEKPTLERYLATIDRFEREVFQIDQAKPKGKRKIITTIGTPINLKDHWQAYQTEKGATIDKLTLAAQQEVQAHLD